MDCDISVLSFKAQCFSKDLIILSDTFEISSFDLNHDLRSTQIFGGEYKIEADYLLRHEMKFLHINNVGRLNGIKIK